MRNPITILFFICLGLMWAVQTIAAETVPGKEAQPAVQGSSVSANEGIPEFFVPPPPFSEGIFPCSDCHADMKTNEKRRELKEFHEDIKIINHNEKERWCLDCHDSKNRDMLRLASGKLVSFKESYYLCGQCHGTIYRDWKAGVHGRRTGQWNGKKLYRSCVNCHNPHQPRFKPIAPMPPPQKPSEIK